MTKLNIKIFGALMKGRPLEAEEVILEAALAVAPEDRDHIITIDASEPVPKYEVEASFVNQLVSKGALTFKRGISRQKNKDIFGPPLIR